MPRSPSHTCASTFSNDNYSGYLHPGRPVPILDVHGTKDPILPYAGISVSENPAWPLPSIPHWLQDWASRDGCARGPVTFFQQSTVIGEQWTACLKRRRSLKEYKIAPPGRRSLNSAAAARAYC